MFFLLCIAPPGIPKPFPLEWKLPERATRVPGQLLLAQAFSEKGLFEPGLPDILSLNPFKIVDISGRCPKSGVFDHYTTGLILYL